jgi:hypothetical protein
MKKIRHIIAWVMFAPIAALARPGIEAPNWDSKLASQAARVPASETRVEDLLRLARQGDTARLNSQLGEVIAGHSMSQPARDYVLFRFTTGLADLTEVDPQVLERLKTVEPAVLVPHPERYTASVPLFNISGAARGVEELCLRRQAKGDATRILGVAGDQWVETYLLASHPQRMGFSDALAEADDQALSEILDAALSRLPSSPQLTPVAGKSALLLGDARALQSIIRHGSGSELSHVLEAAARTLAPAESLALLEAAIASAPPSNASLAIAQLYPALAGFPGADGILFEQLGNADLGAAAAMALAAAGGPGVRSDLQHLAQREDGLASARARTALALEPGQEGRQ